MSEENKSATNPQQEEWAFKFSDNPTLAQLQQTLHNFATERDWHQYRTFPTRNV